MTEGLSILSIETCESVDDGYSAEESGRRWCRGGVGGGGAGGEAGGGTGGGTRVSSRFESERGVITRRVVFELHHPRQSSSK
jgi:hypothetical protein